MYVFTDPNDPDSHVRLPASDWIRLADPALPPYKPGRPLLPHHLAVVPIIGDAGVRP